MSLHKLSLYELHEKFTAGEVTAVEIVRAYGLRIGQVEPKVKAYITQVNEAAAAQAGALDASLKGWRKTLPMMGMPLAIKDNLCVEYGHTTCSSKMLANFKSPYSATVIQKLEAAGAIVTPVSSVQAALSALDQATPNLLISDIGMPNQDGYMLISQLRSRRIDIPAIAITAYAREEDRQKVMTAGFQTYLTKPIEPEAVITAITKLNIPVVRR